MIKNEVNLSICIWEFEDVKHDQISKSLQLEPYKIYTKGKRINPKLPKIAKYNGWIYRAASANKGSFEEQMNDILDVLEPKIEILKSYSKKYLCEFSCAIFLHNNEESTPWIHLDKRYHEFAKKVDIEFDFDIYY